jgi:diaminobutyrate acetyltransferase
VRIESRVECGEAFVVSDEIFDRVELRNFQIRDVGKIRDLVSGCAPLEAHTEFTYWVLSSYFSELCFVAETQSGIEGFVSAVSNSSGCCYLWQICVAPKWRGGPLGQALIAAVVDGASKSGCRTFQFSIDPENKPSKGLFSRFAGRRGFEMRRVGTVGCEVLYEWDIGRVEQVPPDVVFSGYFPGAPGQILDAHGRYYGEVWGFDASFEIQEGRELSEFIARFVEGRDFLSVARFGEAFAGSIAVDGSCGSPDGARLRWFIVPRRFQGRGIGKALISDAMAFCRSAGYGRVHLWTFSGLDAARYLYEKQGFRLVAERAVRQWGREVVREQKFFFEADRE